MADVRLFQVVHVNIRGIRSNKVNLQHYLEQHHFPDIVTVNESKLNVNQPFLLPYYDCVASRGSCPYGSIIFKRKDILDVSVIEDFNQFNEEILGIRINGNSFRPKINIVTYYNPPNTSVNPRII
jgi:exonuclease III